MSWSVTFIGHPENIVNALEAESDKLNGQSKVEFDAALPHLAALVKENFAPISPMLKLSASGHGYIEQGKNEQRQFTCSIENIYGILV